MRPDISLTSRKLFLSAVTDELGDYRRTLKSILVGPLLEVKEQTDFLNLGRDTLSMLDQYISTCNGVVHLLGDATGSCPDSINVRDLLQRHPDLHAKLPFLDDLTNNGHQISYTQWEAYLSIYYGVDLYLFRPSSTAKRGDKFKTDPAQHTSQEQHRQRLEKINRFGKFFDNTDKLCIQVLQELVNARLSPFLSEKAKRLIVPNNLPIVGSLFKGRDQFIEQLRSLLTSRPTHIAAVTAKQAIHGLGGVGKTRVAIEYAKRFSGDYTALLFVTADSPANLQRNLASLCGALILNLPEQVALEQEVQVAAALRWLHEHSGWFLIVDNVDTDEAALAVEGLLGRLETGHIVITSRLAEWHGAVEALALDVLHVSDAQQFLLQRTEGRRKPQDSDPNDSATLSNALGYLPLALEQAGAFIVKHGGTISDYYQRWKAQEAKVLNWHDQRAMKYPTSVATTWQTSFDQLTSDGRSLLNILAWLAQDPIPLTMLEKISARDDEIPIDVETAIADLAEYSLLKWTTADHDFVQVHILVQEVTRFRLPQPESKTWLCRALHMVNVFIPMEPSCEDVALWADVYLPAQNHIVLVTRLADSMEIFEPTTRLMSCLGGFLYFRASFAAAESLMRRALAIEELSYGVEDIKISSILNNLAMLLQGTNRLGEAESLMLRSMKICEKTYGNNDIRTARAVSNLGWLYKEQNRLSEAESLMKRALALHEEFFGPDHSEVAVDLNNLALVRHELGKTHEAVSLMRRALAIDKKTMGAVHPRVSTRLANLAYLLIESDQLAEAEPLALRALNIDEMHYGTCHPIIAGRLNNLAILLQKSNRFPDAEPLMRRVLSIDQKFYGEIHPNIARDLNNLAQLLIRLDRLPEAEPLLRRALHVAENCFAQNNPYIAICLNNLAKYLQITNRLSEAEELMWRQIQILHSFRKETGVEHVYTLDARSSYLRLLQSMGLSSHEAFAKIQAKLQEDEQK